MNLANCNESKAIKTLAKAKVALLPIGATEPHGEHLPLGTDTCLAERFSEQIADQLKDRCIVLPALPYSQVWSLKGFAGAIDIGNDLLSELVTRLARNMKQYDIHAMAVINTHFGNFDALKTAARQLKQEGIDLFVFSWPGTQSVINQVRETEEARVGYMHACEIETSLALALMPEQVEMKLATKNYPQFPEHFSYLPIPWTDFSHTATLGDPTKASADKGELIIQASLKTITQVLNHYLEDAA